MSTTPTAWCGLDVSKNTFDASLLVDQRVADLAKLPHQCFCRNPEGVQAFITWLHNHLRPLSLSFNDVGVVMEATGTYSSVLAEILLNTENWHTVAIVNPRLAKAFMVSLNLRNKTDKIDARALAFFGRDRQPYRYEIPSASRKQLKALTRHRRDLVETRVAFKQRKNEADDPFVVDSLNRIDTDLEEQINKIDGEMARLVKETPELNRDVGFLTSIPGVGLLTASVVLAELGDLRRYRTSRQVSSQAGLSPRVIESGSSIKGKTRLANDGNYRVRRALYMAASMAHQPPHSPLRGFFNRLVENGKVPKQARCAVMRKLLVLMRSLLVNNDFYRDDMSSSAVAEGGTAAQKDPAR